MYLSASAVQLSAPFAGHVVRGILAAIDRFLNLSDWLPPRSLI